MEDQPAIALRQGLMAGVEEAGIRIDQFRRQPALAQSQALVIEISQQRVQQARTLLQPSSQRAPVLAGHQQGNRIHSPATRRAARVAKTVVGDAIRL